MDNAQAIWISGQFFQVLGVQAILGRLISPADDPENEQAGCSGAGTSAMPSGSAVTVARRQ